MKSWDSLFFPSNDSGSIVTSLQQSLTTLGFTLFNPFGLIPGRPYAHTVRMFVAPSASGWVRVIGTPDHRLFPHLSQTALCLYTALTENGANITTYQSGERVNPVDALKPCLREGITADMLSDALQRATIRVLPPDEPVQTASPFDVLPSDMQSLTSSVDPSHAQAMFENLTGGLMGKLARRTGENADDKSSAARELISASTNTAVDWNSPDGQHIRAVINCLTIPDNWRTPDFEALRDAYPLHERRRRKPDARLYPGDAEAMALVPDALSYIPVYGGID